MFVHRDRPQVAVLPIRVAAISIIVFAIAALLATLNSVAPGDELALDAFQDLPANPFEILLATGNLLGDTVAGPVAVLLLAILCVWRNFIPGIIFCVSMLAFRFGGMFLKQVFDSPRPQTDHADIRGDFVGLGFPSGHTMTAVCIAMSATIILPALFANGPALRTVIGALWALTVLCGIARMWYGAHWPTDVIGGAAVAVSIAWASAWIAGRYQVRETKRAKPITSTVVAARRITTSR